jgi:hypothetical protein
MQSPILALCLLAVVRSVVVQVQETPITKVVGLINEMKAKI